MKRTVLILGARGRFGRNASRAFGAAGWQVRHFVRGRDDLATAAEGVSTIVNGWNPAYPDWAAQVPAMTSALIDVAERTGARVILPGNLYVYGDEAPALLQTHTPKAASNPLGRVRVEMETAWKASAARVTILRAGDFIDTGVSGNWFDLVLTAKLNRGIFTYPGSLDRSHAWAFLPDLARTAVAVAEKGDQLGRYVDLPFAGYTLTGSELHAALERAIGRTLRLKQMPWWPLRAMSPFNPMMRCLCEMRYLWGMPHRIDPAPLKAILGDVPGTPLEVALRHAVGHDVHPDQPMPRGQSFARRAVGVA